MKNRFLNPGFYVQVLLGLLLIGAIAAILGCSKDESSPTGSDSEKNSMSLVLTDQDGTSHILHGAVKKDSVGSRIIIIGEPIKDANGGGSPFSSIRVFFSTFAVGEYPFDQLVNIYTGNGATAFTGNTGTVKITKYGASEIAGEFSGELNSIDVGGYGRYKVTIAGGSFQWNR